VNRRAIILVLDGVGIGEAPDAAAYGDVGSHTLGNVARAVGGLRLPHLQAAGLGNIAPLEGCPPAEAPTAAWGRMLPRSAGKDSTTGHWEIAQVVLETPFPTYPDGFPPALLAEFTRRTGRPVIGNVAGSGTAIIEAFAEAQRLTGAWIVYTSADSVFQVAADEAVIPLAELFAACEIARELLAPPHAVSRVIARPYVRDGNGYRRTASRRDYSLVPPAPTLLDRLAAAGVPRHGIGKVDDLFAGRAIASVHTSSNAEGIAALHDWLAHGDGFCFANLVDFDQLFGHRNDVAGFDGALRAFDAALPAILATLRQEDLLFVTADHGNDPTTASTDHAREQVPLLACGPRVRPVSLGTRQTFADLGATVGAWFGAAPGAAGTSFLPALLDG
jgi:phosphopentomutase